MSADTGVSSDATANTADRISYAPFRFVTNSSQPPSRASLRITGSVYDVSMRTRHVGHSALMDVTTESSLRRRVRA